VDLGKLIVPSPLGGAAPLGRVAGTDRLEK